MTDLKSSWQENQNHKSREAKQALKESGLAFRNISIRRQDLKEDVETS